MDSRCKEECCGTCRYHRFDKDEQEWTCNCRDSENYADYTAYDDECDEWEGRK